MEQIQKHKIPELIPDDHPYRDTARAAIALTLDRDREGYLALPPIENQLVHPKISDDVLRLADIEQTNLIDQEARDSSPLYP